MVFEQIVWSPDKWILNRKIIVVTFIYNYLPNLSIYKAFQWPRNESFGIVSGDWNLMSLILMMVELIWPPKNKAVFELTTRPVVPDG